MRGSQKGLPDGTVNGKRIKMIQNNVVMVGLTISMHFQQFEELNFIYFFRGSMPLDLLKPLQRVQPSQFGRDCPDFTRESLIPTRLQTVHEYPDFEDQLSQANQQRNRFLLNYHNICHKMNKPLDWIST